MEETSNPVGKVPARLFVHFESHQQTSNFKSGNCPPIFASFLLILQLDQQAHHQTTQKLPEESSF
jgi:hypothetical protein